MLDNNEFTDINGIAEMLGVSIRTIKRWKREKFIPFHQSQPKSRLRFHRKSVQIWWMNLHTSGKKKLNYGGSNL
ncbi:MAG: helix-turn-helix domain-containing protein [Fibrobacteria bacterium]|nr:helix-turn-helix domain-containing protein [Fibrobacteria bacterium]